MTASSYQHEDKDGQRPQTEHEDVTWPLSLATVLCMLERAPA